MQFFPLMEFSEDPMHNLSTNLIFSEDPVHDYSTKGVSEDPVHDYFTSRFSEDPIYNTVFSTRVQKIHYSISEDPIH